MFYAIHERHLSPHLTLINKCKTLQVYCSDDLYFMLFHVVYIRGSFPNETNPCTYVM